MRASPNDPLTWLWTLWRGTTQFFSGDFIATLETMLQFVRLRPGYVQPREYIAASLAYLELRLDEARDALERIRHNRRSPASALAAKAALAAA